MQVLTKFHKVLFNLISRSGHRTNNYESQIFATNSLHIYFLSVLPGHNITLHPQMAYYITLCIKKIKTLCNTLDWGNWNSEFVKLLVWWVERDIKLFSTLWRSRPLLLSWPKIQIYWLWIQMVLTVLWSVKLEKVLIIICFE